MHNRQIIAPKPKLLSSTMSKHFSRTNQKKREENMEKVFKNKINTEHLEKEFQDLEAKSEILKILQNDILYSLSLSKKDNSLQFPSKNNLLNDCSSDD